MCGPLRCGHHGGPTYNYILLRPLYTMFYFAAEHPATPPLLVPFPHIPLFIPIP